MKKTILLVMLLASFQAYAGDWSDENTTREIIWQTINVIDWGQTLDIADKCRTPIRASNDEIISIRETNSLLRGCPTFSEVNKHFIFGALLHFGVSYALPSKYRAGFQWVTIGYGIHIINGNARIGLEMKF